MSIPRDNITSRAHAISKNLTFHCIFNWVDLWFFFYNINLMKLVKLTASKVSDLRTNNQVLYRFQVILN